MNEILNVTHLFKPIIGRTLRTRSLNQIKYLMIHHTASLKLSNEMLHRLHTDIKHKWATCGYHFYIRKNNNIYQMNNLSTITNGCKDFNTNTIHVCFEGNYMIEPAGDDMLINLEIIIKDLKLLKLFPDLITHRERGKTLCPGNHLHILIDNYRRLKKSTQGLIWGELEY